MCLLVCSTALVAPSLNHLCTVLMISGPPTQETIAQALPLPPDVVCIVCNDRPRQVLFQPCDHIVVCEECSASLTHCPRCGEFIVRKVKFKMENIIN